MGGTPSRSPFPSGSLCLSAKEVGKRQSEARRAAAVPTAGTNGPRVPHPKGFNGCTQLPSLAIPVPSYCCPGAIPVASWCRASTTPVPPCPTGEGTPWQIRVPAGRGICKDNKLPLHLFSRRGTALWFVPSACPIATHLRHRLMQDKVLPRELLCSSPQHNGTPGSEHSPGLPSFLGSRPSCAFPGDLQLFHQHPLHVLSSCSLRFLFCFASCTDFFVLPDYRFSAPTSAFSVCLLTRTRGRFPSAVCWAQPLTLAVFPPGKRLQQPFLSL